MTDITVAIYIPMGAASIVPWSQPGPLHLWDLGHNLESPIQNTLLLHTLDTIAPMFSNRRSRTDVSNPRFIFESTQRLYLSRGRTIDIEVTNDWQVYLYIFSVATLQQPHNPFHGPLLLLSSDKSC